jgi:hypothetical protein
MEEMTLDDLQSAIRGAHDVKPAPLTDADVAPKRSPLSTFIPGTQIAPQIEPPINNQANDLTQDDIERVLSLAMTGGDEELPKDGRWHVPSVKDALAKAFEARQAMPGFLASTADVTVGNVLPTVAGGLTYPIARIFQMPPEKAQALREEVTGALDKPFGKALGLTESPSYTGSAPSQLMNYIGKYAHMGVDWLSKETGLPPGDVQSYIDSLTLAAPKIASTTGQGLKASWDWMRESPPVKGVQQLTHELKTGETPPPPPAPIEPMMDVNQQPSQMIGGGAASTSPSAVLQGNIDAALANASPELQAHINAHPPENINLPALETRALEEKHGVNLTTGQRTGDTQLYSQEWNKRGETPTLGSHFDSQPQQISSAFESAKQRHAPDIPSTADASELGQHQINALAAKDKIRTDAITDAYQKLTDANGGQFPIDVGTLQNNIATELSKVLKTNHLPESINADMRDFYKNPTFEAYEALRTNLANEMRSNSNGNARGAAYIVRGELEKLPVFGEGTGNPQAIQLKQLADNARGLVKERYSVLNNNPAYKAATKEFGSLNDAASQGESLNAANFQKKFVANATPEAIRRMKAEIPADDIAHQAITFGELERAKSAAVNASERNLTPDQFVKFLKNNKSGLRESLSPEAMQDVSEIGALTSKIGMPKTGVFNYSNTYSSELANLAKQGLTSAAEAKLTSMTGGASYPITQLGRQWFSNLNKEGFAKRATDPTGGLTKE